MLFEGVTIRNSGGAIRFSFCPSQQAWDLSPGHAVTLLKSTLRADKGALSAAPAPAFCDLPLLPRHPRASTFGVRSADPVDGSLESRISALPAERQQELRPRLIAIDAALAAHSGDLSTLVARGALLQQFGLNSDASAQFHQIAGMFPDATFTRGVILPPAPPAQPIRAPGKTYALLIGISQYKYDPPVPALQFADKDAELFANLLETPRGGALPPNQIAVLENGHATRARIEVELGRLVRENAGARDNTLILFVAGHGGDVPLEIDPKSHKTIRQAPYIFTHETNTQDPNTTGYPMDEFAGLVAKETGLFRRVLVFVDVCHASEIGPYGTRDLAPAVEKAFLHPANEFGMLLASKQEAYESALFGGGHGAFTYFVIDGWNGAAARQGGKTVDFGELERFVGDNVENVTRSAQRPDAVDPNKGIVITPDTTLPGIHLDAATPLPENAVRRPRAVSGAALITSSALERPGVPSDSSFQQALDAGVLLPEEPGSASNILALKRSDPSAPPAQLQDFEDRLRSALEDRGQQTILRYLEGDQIPQRKEDFVRGGRYFQEALRLAPDAAFDESRMLFCQGRAQIFDHAYAEARQLLERSIRIDPGRGYAYNALGIAYFEQIAANQASFDLAIRAFHDAIRFAPNWAYPRHNLALAYSENGDYGSAEKTYAEAMQVGGSYSYLAYNLGLLYQKLNDFPAAERSYRMAMDISSRNQGRGDAADRSRERSAIENALGTIEAARGRADKAESWYRKALADNAESANARHNLALLLSRSASSAEAERLWQANLTADPQDLPSLMGYADYLARTGKPDQAEDLYGRVIMLRPQYAGARRKLAGVFLQQDRTAPALEQLKAAASEGPGDAAILEQIGDLEAKLGDTAAAQGDWQRAAGVAESGQRRRLLKKLQQNSVN